MKHDSSKTHGDLLRQAAETGFPDKEATRRRILAYAESENTSSIHKTDSPPEGKSPGDRTQPHRRRHLTPGKRIALAGGFLAAALAIVLIASSLLNRGNRPSVSPETTLPPVTNVSEEETSAITELTTAESVETTQETPVAHFVEGILLDQHMLYSTNSDLGPVQLNYNELESYATLEIGAHYRFTYNGQIDESYPGQISVLGIELLDSADSAWIAEAPINPAVSYLSYSPDAHLVDAREADAYGTGIIPIPDSSIDDDDRETILLPLPDLAGDPEATAAALAAAIADDPASAPTVVFVYADTRENSVEAARLIREAGFPVTISLGAVDDYEGDLVSLSEQDTYTEYTGYLLQDDLFFAESAIEQSRYSITYFEDQASDSDREYPVYVHTLEDRIALDELANAEFEPTSEPISFPHYLISLDEDNPDMSFYIDMQGVAAGPLLGAGGYRILGKDADEVFSTIDRIHSSQTGRLSPGLVRITAGSFPAPAVIGGYYRVEMGDAMTASDPPLAAIRQAVALEDSASDVIRELPIRIVSEHLSLLGSVTLLDVRPSSEYEAGFIPAFNAETQNLPFEAIEDGTANVKAILEAEAGPDVPLEEHLVLVYGETSMDAGEAVRLLKQAGIPAVLSVGSIDNYEGELARRPESPAQKHSYEMDGIEFLLTVESPTKIVLEARPIGDDVLLATAFNYEYALDIKRGDEWEAAPLVPGDSDVRELNEWAMIVPDDHGSYRVMQPTDMGFASVADASFIESFDLTMHTVLEPGETYRLSKSYRFTMGDIELEEKIYEFEFLCE